MTNKKKERKTHMKNRIISLILALVIAFSCLSLNIFAAAGEAQDATTKDVASSVTGEADKITLEELCKEQGIGQDNGGYNLSAEEIYQKVTESDGSILYNTEFGSAGFDKTADKALGSTGTASVSNTNDIISYANDIDSENWYIKFSPDEGDNPSGNYLQWSGGPQPSDASKYKQYEEAGYIGAPYALTFDIMYYDESELPGGRFFDAFRSYAVNSSFTKNRAEAGYNAKISEDGELLVANAGSKTYTPTGFTFKKDVWAQVTFYHTPRGLDGDRATVEDNNKCHVFVNGVYYATVTAVSEGYTTDWDLTLDETTGETVTLNSAYDFMLHTFRIGQYNAGIGIDNLRVYRGDFLECLHEWEYSHKHDAANNELVLTAHCANCKKTESKSIPSAVASGEYGLSVAALAEKLAEEGRKPFTNTDFENVAIDEITNLTFFNKETNDYFEWKNIVTDTDTDGNKFAKWQRPKAYSITTGELLTEEEYNALSEISLDAQALLTLGDDGVYYYNGQLGTQEYFQANYQGGNGVTKTLVEQGDTSTFGKTFTVTTDFIHYGNQVVAPIQVSSRTAKTADTNFAAISKALLYVTADGKITSDKNGTKLLTDETIPANTKVQLSVMVTPRGLDGDKSTEDDNNTYHIFINGKCVAEDLEFYSSTVAPAWNYTYTPAGSTEETTVTIDPILDYTLRYVRIGGINGSVSADVMALDNFRTYYGVIEECAHSPNAATGACDWCGEELDFSKCMICDGHILSEHSAVTDRNVVLGDMIKLNTYLTIDEALAKTEGAKLVIDSTADGGTKSEEYLISELSPETEGALAGKYKITLPLRSIDLLRKVKVSIVADGETCVAYETTVDEYLTALENISESEEEIALINAMRDYGKYAQAYFAGADGEELLTLGDAELSELASYAIDVNGNGVTDLSASLILSSKTMMKLFFVGDETATVKIDGVAVSKTASEESGEYYVTVTANTPDAMADEHTVEITTADGTTTVTLSVFSTLYAVITNASASNEYKNLAAATYLYANAAIAYKTN